MVLMILYCFYEKGTKEVRLSQFLETIKEIQKKIPLDYGFSDGFLYSPDLFEDLRDLEFKGLTRRPSHRVGTLILRRIYITLTPLGRVYAQKELENLDEEHRSLLQSSVHRSIHATKTFYRPVSV